VEERKYQAAQRVKKYTPNECRVTLMVPFPPRHFAANFFITQKLANEPGAGDSRL
jgi:hypothetical protein